MSSAPSAPRTSPSSRSLVADEALLHVALRGAVRITVGSRGPERLLKYRKSIAVLAFLAVPAGRWHARDALAQLFWPALDASAARVNLRQVLWDLRQTLNVAPGIEPLRTRGDLVCLNVEAGVRLDVAGRADRPATGSVPDGVDEVFLAGMAWPELPEFEAWLQGARRRLAEHGEAALMAASRARREAGEVAEAIALARRLAALSPLDEGHVGWLMSLLLEVGEHQAALACHDAFAARLLEEVGTRPGDGLARLRERAASPVGSVASPTANFTELRWISVLYCLPGASGDDEQHERTMDVLRTVVTRWKGRLQPSTGRGVMAVFGLGEDGERSMVRALQAASDIHARLAGQLAPRSCVCTGQVLVHARDAVLGLLGDVPDIAMQIGWMARPGEILAPESVVLQADGHFSFDALGERECAAAGGPVAVFRLRTAPSAWSRHAAADAPPRVEAAPFVGRDEVFETLFALWQGVRDGGPCVARLQAPAGFGKTRLSSELAARVAAAGGQVRRLLCRLEWCHQPLQPVLSALSDYARGRAADDTPPRRAHRLRRRLAALRPRLPAASIDALAALLEPTGQALAPAKDALFGAIIDLVDALSTQGPMLLVVDDLHWCDQTTLELLGVLVRSLGTRQVMLLVTQRPGVALEWPEDGVHGMNLSPMPPDEALALVTALDPEDRIVADDRRRIVAACGGVPLFIERSVKSRLEGNHHLQTIDELLQTELSRLGAARRVLCAAAVLGGRFKVTQLQALLPEDDVGTTLSAAQRLRLITDEGADEFAFGHALIRDAAYACLPRAQSTALHLSAARLLEAHAESAQAVAHHYAAASQWARAATWWLKAGDQAMAAEFAADAMHAFGEALKLLQAHDASADDLLAARMRLGRSAQLAQGFGSPLAYGQFAEAQAALEAAPVDTPEYRHRLFEALSGRYMGGSSQGAVEGLDIAWRLADLAEAPTEKLMASFALGNSLFWRGRLRVARDWQERGVALARQLGAGERERFCVDDPAITCRAFLGWTLWFLGEERAACRAAAEGVALARAGRRMHALCFALTFAAALHWCRGDEVAVRRLSGEARALARQHGFPLWESVNALFLMWVSARQQRLEDTESLFQAAENMKSAYAAGVTTARWIAAHALIARGDAWVEAESLLDTTIAEAAFHEDQYCLADLFWQKAACLRRRGEYANAQRYRRRARALARKQQALGLLARFG